MHLLHDYVAKQLADRVKERRVVVWYDERSEFRPFVDELRSGARPTCDAAPVVVAATSVSLVEYNGSLFELRTVVEPLVSDDKPEALVVYVAGVAHDAKASALMELEKAGRTWKPELKQLARNVLLQKYTLGVVDEMLLFDRKVTYEDLARAAEGGAGAEAPSILKSIFHDISGHDWLLAAWVASDARDAEIETKEAARELTLLVKARLGLELVADAPLAKLRAITARHVLACEFRLDLSCEPPTTLDGIAAPATKDEATAVREIARRLRTTYPDAYTALADRVEEELGLKNAKLPPEALGTIDTFRFEERVLLGHACELIAIGEFAQGLELVEERQRSFWLDRDVSRRAQWEAVKRMAELGSIALDVRAATGKASSDPAEWLRAYVASNGYFRLDHAQRRLEVWIATLDEEPEERPLGVVRRAHEDTCHAMAQGFARALRSEGWTVPGTLHQTRVWSEAVAEKPRPVAYFLVDAMRFEMGAELAERLPKTAEVSLKAAVGALPSITPVGMAALMPGASASYSLVGQGGKLGARIEGSFLPDLPSRKKFASARVPKILDIALNELLGLQPSKLAKKLEGVEVVMVRSQEIDAAGEAGFAFQARQAMDTVIDNLVRAIRKLSALGVEHAVVTADHGHLFFANDRDESMKIDPPGGETLELHRRCWIGRGGQTPSGCIRVSASALGYDSDLEFVFPPGVAVFKAGGDLAYYHGGVSLQELAIPVLSVVTKAPTNQRPAREPITVSGVPSKVTNRIFTVSLALGGNQMSLGASETKVQGLLLSNGKQVGSIGMAVDAPCDRDAGIVTLEPGTPVTVAFLLHDESSEALRIVLLDPATDAELYRSPNDIPVHLSI